MGAAFHYPPDLMHLLIEAIPRLCRGKRDLLLFFEGAGVPNDVIVPLTRKLRDEVNSVSKYDITRAVLSDLNRRGDAAIRQRREVLRRVTEYEDFSTCWPDDQFKARGLVAEIRHVIGVKDAFTRIDQERERERAARVALERAKTEELKRRKIELASVKADLSSLFAMTNHQSRGKALEEILNRLFRISGIAIREAFTLRGCMGDGVIEQIDGAVELDGEMYLVEMKWEKERLGPGEIGQHLVRVFGRGEARGIFISASGYTPAALQTCRESLQRSVVVLCTIEEFVLLLERDCDLLGFLKEKIGAAILCKDPFYQPLQCGF
jgi:hypothetical protein